MSQTEQSNLQQLIYSSISASDFTIEMLDALVTESRNFNEAHEISGVLAYADGVFIQVLEGDRQTIHRLYKAIGNDERHHTVVSLHDAPLKARMFANWSLALDYVVVDSEDNLTEPSFENFKDIFSSDSGQMLAKLIDTLDIGVDEIPWG